MPLKIPENYHFVLLSNYELKEIISALEKISGQETELGNDLKMVIAGTL